jgi:WD40 repeat protein
MDYMNIKSTDCQSIGSIGFAMRQLDGPRSVVYDQYNEHLIISEWIGCRVQVICDDETHVRFIGEPGTSKGQFRAPWGLSLSHEGHLFVCDYFNDRVQSFDISDGQFIRQYSMNSQPCCCTLTQSNDRLFVSLSNGQVYEYTQCGSLSRSFISTQSEVNNIISYTSIGLAFNSHNDLFISDSSDQSIRLLDLRCDKPVVNIQKTFGTGRLHLAVDTFDRLIVSASKSHSLYFFESDLELITSFGSKGELTGQFNRPEGVCVGDNGRLFVCDYKSHQIQIIRPPYSY